MVAGLEPNAENKLFVGGCPPGSGEEDLRLLFEKHGRVEEVFVMRGGSRSGMACAFVRFANQQMAQQAIDAIHGQHTLPNSVEPLVVRWADAPGARKRDTREGGRKQRGSGGNGGNGGGTNRVNWGGMMMMAETGYYPNITHAPYPPFQNMYGSQQAAIGGSYAGGAMSGSMMAFATPQMMPYMASMPYMGPPSPQQPSMMSGMVHYGANANLGVGGATPPPIAQRGA